MRVSFVGTGLMGKPMAERLLSAGYELYVYNRTMEKTYSLKDKGAKVAITAREAIHLSNVTILMLANGKAVNDVLFSEEQDFTDKIIIQMSTIAPSESREFSAKIHELKGYYMEAPVLGSTPQASEGKLFVMFGGDSDQFEKQKSILQNLGNVSYIGEAGKAAALKLAFNQLIASLGIAFSLSLGIIQKENIDLDKFMDILRNSVLYAKTYDAKLKNYLSRDFSTTHFPVKHLLKDVNLVYEEAKSLGLETASVEAISKILKDTVEKGLGDMDYSALFNTVVPENK